MNKKQIERWRKTRRLGKENFILTSGGMIAILLGVIYPLSGILAAVSGGTFSLSYIDNMGFVLGILFRSIFGFFLGCLLGWLAWLWNEWQYSQRS